jgi:hypothetical protein
VNPLERALATAEGGIRKGENNRAENDAIIGGKHVQTKLPPGELMPGNRRTKWQSYHASRATRRGASPREGLPAIGNHWKLEKHRSRRRHCKVERVHEPVEQ